MALELDLGLFITLATLISFIWLLYSLFQMRRRIISGITGMSKASILGIILIVSFFLAFSLLYMHPVEQLYFDENIYQGIALNILHNFNSEWCQYGTGNLATCYANAIYHDPVEISFYLAIAFGIFGAGTSTAYNVQLVFGTLSIIFVFALAYALFNDERIAVSSSFIFSLMPELFIWSRTQAVPDLPFMMLTVLSFLSLAALLKEENKAAFSFFFSSILLAVYMRIEGILLIPMLFLLFMAFRKYGEKSISGKINELINIDTSAILQLIFFLILLIPQAYYISYQLSNLNYGQSAANQSLFSPSNFYSNVLGGNYGYSCQILGSKLGPNICYFLGFFDKASYYPASFPALITAISAIGLLLLAFRKRKHRKICLASLAVWAASYYLFYGFFYAGSVTFGVDVRFMLEILPPISIFAGIAISDVSSYISSFHAFRSGRAKNAAGALSFIALLLAAGFYPFYTSSLQSITLAPSNMPQQSVILPAMNFFYANYSSVPKDCLVFTYTPDIWYEVNRSAAQISYINSQESAFLNNTSGYRCFVLDRGYWCNVPPALGNGGCMNYIYGKKFSPLAIENYTGGLVFAYYNISNYR